MSVAENLARVESTHSTAPGAKHTIELFLDYVCPFSGKLFYTLQPLIALQDRTHVNFVFRQQPQPWHPVSPLVHEAALAALTLVQDKPIEEQRALFWDVSRALFDKYPELQDEPVYHLSRDQIYLKLSAIVADATGLSKDAVYDQLVVPVAPARNGGNKTTNLLKATIRYHRSKAIHVTPTVVVDGAVRDDIESSFTADQWKELLAKL